MNGLRSAATSWDVSGLEKERLEIPPHNQLAGPGGGCSACGFFQKTLRCRYHHFHFVKQPFTQHPRALELPTLSPVLLADLGVPNAGPWDRYER